MKLRPLLAPAPLLLGSLLLLALAARPLSATSYVMVGDEALADQASIIVEVEVVSAEPSPAPARAATDYLVEVQRVVKGFVPASSLIVRVPGAQRSGALSLEIWGMPHLTTGDIVLLFLVPNADGSFGLLHLMLGAFERFAVDGKTYAMRFLDDATEVANPTTGAKSLRESQPRHYEAFLAWLTSRVEGDRRAVDYFAPEGTRLTTLFQKFTLIRDNETRLNSRWFEFDSGGSLSWYAHQSGQQGVAGGGFAQFQNALAAWNADPVTPIQLLYRGTTTASGGFDDTGDGRNTLLFNDPNDEISGAFDCNTGGVLAIGGPRYNLDFRGTFNDQEYLRILETEIVTNDGLSCFFANTDEPAKVFEEIVGHELGHTLGLGHSCGDNQSPTCGSSAALNDALMRARAHADGRGARLAQDDLAGARALYRPAAGGGGGGVPAAPTALTATLDGLAVNLSWSDNASNEQGYWVYRKAGGAFAKIADLPAGSTAYRDEATAASTTYSYQVSAANARGEKKSNVVTLAIPAALPITVELDPETVNALTGQAVELRALTTGPVVRVEWTVGPTLGFSPAPCAAARFCLPHVFREAGIFPITLVAVGDLGQRAQATGSVTVRGAPTPLATAHSAIQSVIFGPRGNTGTFASNCWTHNASGQPALVNYTYLRRGTSNPNPPRREVTVPPASTVFLDNIVHRLFGESDSQGALLLTYEQLVDGDPPSPDPPDVRTICRSFVEIRGGVGSFGLFAGENPESTWTNAPKVVGGVLQDASFGATLLAMNLDTAAGAVIVELTDADGQAVGTPQAFSLTGRSLRSRPLAQMFPQAAGRPSPFTARFTSSGIRFLAAVTLLATGSEDQVFVSAREADAANPVFVPRVSHAASQFDAFLVSRLIVTNNSSQPTQLDIQLWRRGQANLSPQTIHRTVPGGGTLVANDVLGDLFGLSEGVGALRIDWSNSENKAPRIQTYSFNQSAGGEGEVFGMLVDSQPAASASHTTAVDFGAEQSALFRADFGILNLSPGPTEVHVTLKRADGLPLATAVLGLQPQQHLERNLEGIFRDVTIGLGSNWTIETAVTAGGPVLTYLANINASGDIFFVPGREKM